MTRAVFFLLLVGCGGFDANLNVDFAGATSARLKSKVVQGSMNATIDGSGLDGNLTVTPPPESK